MSTEFLKQNDNQFKQDIDKEPEIIKDNSNEEIRVSKQKEILLQLGDIILISDPSNEILNDNVFLTVPFIFLGAKLLEVDIRLSKLDRKSVV
jgi:hypothetical protein